MICWVRPGVLLVRAREFCSVMVLIELDFPELERPAKATSLPVSAGNWDNLSILNQHSACLSGFFIGGKINYVLEICGTSILTFN